MRPLRSTIEGFTAFRDAQTIDFEQLEPVRDHRADRRRQDEHPRRDHVRALRRGAANREPKGHRRRHLPGTGRAAVEFEFRVGAHGRHRVARRISRRQGQSVTLERQEGTEWVPVSTGGVTEANERIQQLIGLDFDGFTRAVILPQGEFHRFLKGETADRRKVLFSLLGVSYFQRMGALARAKCADLEAGVKRTEDLLREHYEEATTKHLKQLRRPPRPPPRPAQRSQQRSATRPTRQQSLPKRETGARAADGYVRDHWTC